MSNFLESRIFRPPNKTYSSTSFPGELCILNGVVCLALASHDPSCRNLVIYCHANSADVSVSRKYLCAMRDRLNVHIIAVEYPGYGFQTNQTPTEYNVNMAVYKVYDYVRGGLYWPPEAITVVGRSIGTGPAILLASTEEVGALVLISAFSSIMDIVDTHFPYVGRLVVGDQSFWDSKSTIKRVRCPTLFLHGNKDTFIPAAQSLNVFEECKSDHKRFIFMDGFGHNGLDFGLVIMWMREFMKREARMAVDPIASTSGHAPGTPEIDQFTFRGVPPAAPRRPYAPALHLRPSPPPPPDPKQADRKRTGASSVPDAPGDGSGGPVQRWSAVVNESPAGVIIGSDPAQGVPGPEKGGESPPPPAHPAAPRDGLVLGEHSRRPSHRLALSPGSSHRRQRSSTADGSGEEAKSACESPSTSPLKGKGWQAPTTAWWGLGPGVGELWGVPVPPTPPPPLENEVAEPMVEEGVASTLGVRVRRLDTEPGQRGGRRALGVVPPLPAWPTRRAPHSPTSPDGTSVAPEQGQEGGGDGQGEGTREEEHEAEEGNGGVAAAGGGRRWLWKGATEGAIVVEEEEEQEATDAPASYVPMEMVPLSMLVEGDEGEVFVVEEVVEDEEEHFFS